MAENSEDKKTVKFTWNDTEIEAPEGENLLKAALDHGIEVAHYCYHPGLPVAGVCRMCMVEQEPGPPRPFPACNANVGEGIKVCNNSDKIKKAVEATLQFHLVNHPLDCPICDQAGECGLQDYYMKHGVYDSNMIDEKVHKRKVQDIGRDVVLDAERCILCSRCVRFTEHITDSHEMGIVNRGDHAEIVAYKQLENDYAQNIVDICPVGALTSKDFRFKQRVWFLEEVKTTCIGCEVGCSITVSQNETGSYRVKPRFDEAVNGYWMCDDGRRTYKHLSSVSRLPGPLKNNNGLFLPADESELAVELYQSSFDHSLILNTQLTNEEYDEILADLEDKKAVGLYRLPPSGEDFDGILKRGNKNVNLAGATEKFKKHGFDLSSSQLDSVIDSSQGRIVWINVPEFLYDEDHFQTLVQKAKAKAKVLVGLTCNDDFPGAREFDYLMPISSFAEKNGSMTNFAGVKRNLKAGISYGPKVALNDYLLKAFKA